jgi:hypothetical protein
MDEVANPCVTLNEIVLLIPPAVLGRIYDPRQAIGQNGLARSLRDQPVLRGTARGRHRMADCAITRSICLGTSVVRTGSSEIRTV